MSFDQYIMHTAAEASKDTKVGEKEAEPSAKNVEAKGVKVSRPPTHPGRNRCREQTLVESVVESDSNATESDDPTKIAPTSYVSGKQKYKGTPKKKMDSDEEDSTYIPTPDEKKKLRRKRKARPVGVVSRSVRVKRDSTAVPEVPIVEKNVEVPKDKSVKVPEVEKAQSVPKVEKVQNAETKKKKAPKSPEYERVEKNVEDVEVEFMGERQSTPPPPPINPTIHIHDVPKDPSQPKKDTTSSSSHGFPRVIGEYPDDLPEGDFDIFNQGKINVLTKKVSLLEKEKSKAKSDCEELKEKLKAVKAENAELKKAANDHADIIDQLTDELEAHAKVIDRITEEFDKVNAKYESMNETNKKLHQMIGELHETSSNENKVLRQEIEALRADKAVKDEQLNMLYTRFKESRKEELKKRNNYIIYIFL
ncbi:hypothetical protein Hanom_Chr16g01462141 [Helianthus anomalus]